MLAHQCISGVIAGGAYIFGVSCHTLPLDHGSWPVATCFASMADEDEIHIDPSESELFTQLEDDCLVSRSKLS